VIHRSLTTGDVDERSSTSPKKKFGRVIHSTKQEKKFVLVHGFALAFGPRR